MSDQNVVPSQTPAPAPSALKMEDTYSYKGWMNSDKFWKRALGVYGYYFVGALMIVVPIMIVLFAIAMMVGAALFGGMMRGGGEGGAQNVPSAPSAKINIDAVCQDALQYETAINDETAAAKYVQDCKDGKHPEAIERYIKSINLPEGTAI